MFLTVFEDFTHVARHTFATNALTDGISIDKVSKMLGHSTITMTQHYAKVLDQSVINEMLALDSK